MRRALRGGRRSAAGAPRARGRRAPSATATDGVDRAEEAEHDRQQRQHDQQAACRAGSGGASRPRRGRPASSARRRARTRPSSAATAPRSAAASSRRRSRTGTARSGRAGRSPPPSRPAAAPRRRRRRSRCSAASALEPDRVDEHVAEEAGTARATALSMLTVSDELRRTTARASTIPKISAARGEIRPAGTGRLAVRAICGVDVAVEPVVDRAGAARRQRAAEQVSATSADRRVAGHVHRRDRRQQQQRAGRAAWSAST